MGKREKEKATLVVISKGAVDNLGRSEQSRKQIAAGKKKLRRAMLLVKSPSKAQMERRSISQPIHLAL